ncbi:MAG: hypothetical protein ACI8ZO_000126 [Flavobacteriales bacterium]|jgi:hypothetical protein
MELEELREKWNQVVLYTTNNFGDGEEMDLDSILFLIGLNELGQGHQKLKKEQKLDVLHIAICSLLSKFDYYKYLGHDDDGWPHYELNEKLPPLKPGQQAILMKEAIVLYFEELEVL